ncbi:MAG: MBL fold metallo-hydrolase [Pseudomonadota bacterium]
MAFEVDFLPVGNGERSGDAIAVRYGTPGNYTIVIYDGGTKESGQALVDHVRQHYQTEYVDHVVNSHPDADHASGLSVVLEQLKVGTLWMHRPWEYSHIICDYFRDGRITSDSLKERLQKKMRAAYDLELLAQSKGIPISEPFQGQAIGLFHVLSPSADWYVHDLIPAFEKSPEQKLQEEAAAHGAFGLLKSAVFDAAKKAATWIAEQWNVELLREDVETSAENESSVILYGYMAEEQEAVLLTGDAGVRALAAAADYLEENNVSAPTHVKFIQVPHHGSRHNVSSIVLDRLIGPRLPAQPVQPSRTAFVSAGAESESHPRKMVINAFIKRGFRVIATKGSSVRYPRNMPGRGWAPATPLTFSDKVEAWD